MARREKQAEAKEALIGKEFEQREAAMEGHIRAAEETASARVAEAESQVCSAPLCACAAGALLIVALYIFCSGT